MKTPLFIYLFFTICTIYTICIVQYISLLDIGGSSSGGSDIARARSKYGAAKGMKTNELNAVLRIRFILIRLRIRPKIEKIPTFLSLFSDYPKSDLLKYKY